MALVVNTNISSLVAQNHLAAGRRDMETAMERLSSGLRINGAADDAAGLAISNRMEAQVRGYTKALQNVNDGISLAQTAEGAQKEITEMLQRMRELAVQASNTTNNATDRASLDDEVQQLIAEIDQIATTTRFNDQVLLDGSYGANIQTGFSLDQNMSFALDSMRTSALGLESGTTSSTSRLEYISDRVSLAGDVAAGDIVINGQNLPAIDISNHEISDVVGIINANITGVTASAFNKVIMGDVGTGITTAGQVSIGVQSIESQFDDPNQAADSGDTGDLEYQSFKIDEATTSLTELAAKITEKTGGLVTASVNTDGKLVLENDTGAGIHVMDTSNNAGATGLTTADADKGSNATERNNNPDYDPTDNGDPNDSREFFGYIKLTSTTNNPITIDIGNKGDDAAGTTAELEQLGFSRINVSDDADSKYSITGAIYDATDSTDVLEVGDIVINGVDVYNSNITTDTVAGKLNAINAVADQTGVTANTFFEYFLDADDLTSVATVAVALELADGSTDSFDMSTTLATLVTNIQTILLPATNTITKTNAEQKIFAELMPDQTSIRIFGETEKVGITMERALAAASTVMGVTNNTTQQFQFGAIQLQTTQDKGISVDLGQNGLANGLGLVQANVSGAEFDENFASASSTGSALSSMDVTTVANATGAITMIDNAIESVSKASSNLGAVQNRLNHVAMNVQETIVNTEAAQSRILDADYAVESARLAKQQVLQQAASAMLAQANASAQSVLTLLGA